MVREQRSEDAGVKYHRAGNKRSVENSSLCQGCHEQQHDTISLLKKYPALQTGGKTWPLLTSSGKKDEDAFNQTLYSILL